MTKSGSASWIDDGIAWLLEECNMTKSGSASWIDDGIAWLEECNLP